LVVEVCLSEYQRWVWENYITYLEFYFSQGAVINLYFTGGDFLNVNLIEWLRTIFSMQFKNITTSSITCFNLFSAQILAHCLRKQKKLTLCAKSAHKMNCAWGHSLQLNYNTTELLQMFPSLKKKCITMLQIK